MSFDSCRAHAPVSSRQRTRTQTLVILARIHITTHTWCVISQHTREVSNHKSHHQPRVMDVFLQDPCTLYSLSPSLCGFQKLGSTMIESEQMHRELHAMLAGFKRTYSGACRICVFGITPSTDLSLRTSATRKCVCVCVCG